MEVPPVKENINKRFMVLATCISCAACWKHASSILKSHEVDAYAFFYKQPETELDLILAMQVIHLCPVNAIIDRMEKNDAKNQVC